MGRPMAVVVRTTKRWKVLKALGLLGMIGGLALYAMAGPDVELQRAGGIAAAMGLPVWLFGRLGTWWDRA